MVADAKPGFSIRDATWERDLERLRTVRIAVFIVEQNIPEELEWDEFDAASMHVIAEDCEGSPVGCGRLLPDGHLGRMAVTSDWRGRGVGAAMLERLVALARLRGDERARLNAQTHAIPFYARFGFTPVGAAYLEAGIPHQAMERQLRSHGEQEGD